MGRPGGCNCCGVPTLETPCYDLSNKAYYKVGGGGWKTGSEFAEYVANQGKSGYYGLTAVKHVQKRSSYGEYSASVYPLIDGKLPPWREGHGNKYRSSVIVPQSYRDSSWYGAITPQETYSDIEELDALYQTGNPDFGYLVPSSWTVTIGSGNEIITIVRKLSTAPFMIFGDDYRFIYHPPLEVHFTVVENLVQYKGQTIFQYETQIPYLHISRYDLVSEPLPSQHHLPARKEYISHLGSNPWDSTTTTGAFVGDVSYCLTYPFFKISQSSLALGFEDFVSRFGINSSEIGINNSAFTHYFETGTTCDFIGPPEGTIELPVLPPFYHVDKSIFGKIEIEAGDFIVFNPYSTNGLGRAATPSDFEWWIPQDGKVEGHTFTYTPSPIHTTYVDNKLDGTSTPRPQQLGGLRNEPIGQTVTFPVGFPGDYDPILAGGSVDFFRKYMSENGLWEDNVNTATKHVSDIIFVSFRTDRSANESGIDIEVDMEVYHPVGDDFKYTITEIVEQGPNLKPTKVKLSNGAVVDVSEIELEEDILSYAMNGRTYYLQTLYLKSLGGDFHNPFKYRVSRIDLVNTVVDIDSIGDEIAGPGGLPPTKGGENSTYIELTDTELRFGLQRNTKYIQTCLKLFEDGNNIRLEMSDFLPQMGYAQLTATSPIGFLYRNDTATSVNPAYGGIRSRVFSDEAKTGDSWVMGAGTGSENHRIGDENVADHLIFQQSQLPKNGYFFGHDLGLKFYIEDIEEWKRQRI
jgi:hypothetical protein